MTLLRIPYSRGSFCLPLLGHNIFSRIGALPRRSVHEAEDCPTTPPPRCNGLVHAPNHSSDPIPRPPQNTLIVTMWNLSADYASPNGTQNFSAQLPAVSSSSSTSDRVAYFGDLQANLKTLQSDINSFLTQKMVDDKAGDAKEEENYGEEVVEED
ncbi:hypothetical protein E8E11_009991 [Didymella keratinophila]|nr:hypothetical protein E8E11_009991 [Didymella keratinophila]